MEDKRALLVEEEVADDLADLFLKSQATRISSNMFLFDSSEPENLLWLKETHELDAELEEANSKIC